MCLVDYILPEPRKAADNVSTFDEQLKVAKLDAFKSSSKNFCKKTHNYVDIA